MILPSPANHADHKPGEWTGLCESCYNEDKATRPSMKGHKRMSDFGLEILPENEKFSRVDLTPYFAVIDQLKRGQQAAVTVDTGEWIMKEGKSTGRGESEKAHERGFRQAASQRGHGLRVGVNHMPGGKTRIKMMLDEKRVFSPEALKKRTDALNKAREARKAAAPVAPAAAPAQATPPPVKAVAK